MRGAFVVAACLLAAACYAPKAPTGIECDPSSPVCPRGQSCVAGGLGYTCEVGGGGGGPFDAPVDQPADTTSLIDAAIDGALPDGAMADAMADASVPIDTDGDGIPDVSDNCPTRSNANQYNEDGDRFGDVCDPCPPIADNAPPDTDGDGVADACDPRPTTAGDSIALFEGFSGGVPASWNKTGTWSAAGGAVVSDALMGKSNLTVAGPTTGKLTVSAGMTLVDAPSAVGDSAAGIVESFDHTVKLGVFCHITKWDTGNTPTALNELAASGTVIDTDVFDFTIGASYVLRQRRDTMARSCDIAHGAATGSASGASAVSPTTPEIGLRIVHAKASFAWLMVVANN